MKKTLFFVQLLCILAVLVSCGSHQNNETGNQKDTLTTDTLTTNTENEKQEVNLPRYAYKHFTGTINDDIQIHLDMLKTNEKLLGNYYYLKTGGQLYLNGNISDNYDFIIKEFNKDNKNTGIFSGEFISNHKITGTWQNPEKPKKLSFSLAENYENAVVFDVYAFTDSLKLKSQKPDMRCDIELRFLHAVDYKDKTILSELQKQINKMFYGKMEVTGTPRDDMQTLRNNYFKEYRGVYGEMKDDFSEDEMFAVYNWSKIALMDIEFNDYDILTLALNTYEYAGGAHGIGASGYYVYDLLTGRQLKNTDIFVSGYEAKLTELIIEGIKQARDLSSDQDLQEFVFDMNSIHPNHNFYANKAGIGFYYNVYEIAAYAYGPTDVFIPYHKLKQLIKKDSPIQRLIN